jgi:hypothetical protein
MNNLMNVVNGFLFGTGFILAAEFWHVLFHFGICK